MLSTTSRLVFLLVAALIASANARKRIVGGSNAEAAIYKGLAKLEFKFLNNKFTTCTGTRIAKKYILTAAHCIVLFNGKAAVVKSSLAFLGKQQTDPQSKAFRFLRFWIHKDYNRQTFENDIAVLELKSSPNGLTFGLSPDAFENFAITFAGYGIITPNTAQTPTNVQKLTDTIDDFEDCVAATTSRLSTVSPNRFDKKLQFCIISPKQIVPGVGGSGGCGGDDGGPSLQKVGGAYKVNGVYSSNYLQCAGSESPYYFTKVDEYIDEIQIILNGNTPQDFFPITI